MLWIVLGVVVAAALYLALAYNGLVGLNNQVANAWRQIDVQLQRRHDLIPNLVNAVRGYMEFERDTLERVVAARSRAVSAAGPQGRARAEGELDYALGRLLAVVERYPELRANRNVLRLQEELATTENQLTFARQLYNDLVMRFNVRQSVFPTNLFARILGFGPAEYFVSAQEARAVPRVDLSLGSRDSSSVVPPPAPGSGQSPLADAGRRPSTGKVGT